MMRSAVLLALTAALAAGCATPVVMKDPASGLAVDCTARAAAALPAPDPLWTGRGVPPPPAVTPSTIVFDQVRRCVAELKRDGWVCASGCPSR